MEHSDAASGIHARIEAIMRAMDTSEQADEVQLGIYRRMKPSERLQVGLDLTELSRHLLAEGIRSRHPEYDDE